MLERSIIYIIGCGWLEIVLEPILDPNMRIYLALVFVCLPAWHLGVFLYISH